MRNHAAVGVDEGRGRSGLNSGRVKRSAKQNRALCDHTLRYADFGLRCQWKKSFAFVLTTIATGRRMLAMETHTAEIFVDGVLLDAFELESAGKPGEELDSDLARRVRLLFECAHGEMLKSDGE